MECPLLPWEVRQAAQKQRETKIRDNTNPRPSVPRSGYPPQRYQNSGPTAIVHPRTLLLPSGPPRPTDPLPGPPLAVHPVEEEPESQELQVVFSPKAQQAENE
jgi:hypothetical protein